MLGYFVSSECCDVAEATSESGRIPRPPPRSRLHAGVTSLGSRRGRYRPAGTRGNRLGRQISERESN